MEIPGTPEEYPQGHNGIVAIVGRANVGKSTLLNHLLQEKVSIVTPIAQTTRNRIRAVLTDDRGQLVFLDTPGLHKANNDLGKIMNQAALGSTKGADIAVMLVDASSKPRTEDFQWLEKLSTQEIPCFIALNKVDKGTDFVETYKDAWTEKTAETKKNATWFEISAAMGAGTEELLAALFEAMPIGPQLFPEDLLTDFPKKLAMADTIREKIIRDLRDELPHAIGVHVNKVKEDGDTLTVDARVYVKKPTQKGIIIGHKGRKLRAAKRAAEKELSVIYEKKIKLGISIRVEKTWSENYFLLQQMGYSE